MLSFSKFLVFTYFCAFVSTKNVPGITTPKDFGVRIVHGDEAADGQFPWQVAIMGKSQSIPSYLCGGALISDQWVLTAGHCIDGAISATIYSGTTKISSKNKTVSQAEEFILHEHFDPTYLNNDIGLIRLKTPLTLNENIQPITLAEEELEANVHVTVSGWGVTSDSETEPYSDVLNYVNLLSMNNLNCRSIFGSQIVTDSLVCTTFEKDFVQGPCLGDSGAPVVSYIGEHPVHVAIFSFITALGCESKYPAGNTRTEFYREWIRNKAGI